MNFTGTASLPSARIFERAASIIERSLAAHMVLGMPPSSLSDFHAFFQTSTEVLPYTRSAVT